MHKRRIYTFRLVTWKSAPFVAVNCEGEAVEVGDQVEVEVNSIAHGGHCVARYNGQVIFVRHAIPGEKVIVEITDMNKNFARGNCVRVIEASSHRINPACNYAHPGGCGGCDFQHIQLGYQRILKAEIIREQFSRLAKLEIEVEVEEVKPTTNWRSRMEFTVSQNRKLALHAARSKELIEVDQCRIAHPDVEISEINNRRLPVGKKVDVIISSAGNREIVVEGRENLALIKESSSGFDFSLNPITFWQSHVSAPQILTEAVKKYSELKQGDHLFDLYGGAGLFTGALINEVGAGGRITLIESDENAIIDARRNFATMENVEIVQARVEKALKNYRAANVVVLDPPRAGAGAAVISAIIKLNPRNIVYVACDPAALARDTAYLRDAGFELKALRAFDLFPMTAHMECVARFMPA
ncbi:MAG: class I SAM-dependent RNA methyltransferase [Candidatus Nanopelagicaceae bacterium]|nr:class I SAM-dependent RNA methyltransferase [Candidatus Nanopelagicaceae bacterium]